MKNIKINKKAFNLKKPLVLASATFLICLFGCNTNSKTEESNSIKKNSIISFSCEEYQFDKETNTWQYNGIIDYEKIPIYDGEKAYYLVQINYDDGSSLATDYIPVSSMQSNIRERIK